MLCGRCQGLGCEICKGRGTFASENTRCRKSLKIRTEELVRAHDMLRELIRTYDACDGIAAEAAIARARTMLEQHDALVARLKAKRAAERASHSVAKKATKA